MTVLEIQGQEATSGEDRLVVGTPCRDLRQHRASHGKEEQGYVCLSFSPFHKANGIQSRWLHTDEIP